ncbi:MAG: GNAT family N-acetyltransferase [Flavimaricola sp.]|nr:GNAT family N-acetyltransferase [Flavimaricola sp.]
MRVLTEAGLGEFGLGEFGLGEMGLVEMDRARTGFSETDYVEAGRAQRVLTQPMLALQQSPVFGAALTRIGLSGQIVALEDRGNAVGRALVMVRSLGPFGRLGLISRGPHWFIDDPRARARALLALSPMGLRMIEAEHPCPSLRLAGYRQVMTPAHVATLDLSRPADLEAGMHHAWRGSLNKARRTGLDITSAPFHQVRDHWLLEEERRMRRQNGYRGWSRSLTLAMAEANPLALRLFTARKAGVTIAAMLFARHASMATYLTGWTGAAGREACAHHLMLVEAASWLANQGHASLDLGTMDTEAAPGLARFKIGCGAKVRPLGGSWLRLPFCAARL